MPEVPGRITIEDAKKFLREEFPTGAQRDTQEGKWRLDLIDPDFELAIAKVMAKGAKPPPEGYGEDNWRKGMPYSRLHASMRRHLMAWWLGKEDEDHLAHLACNIMFAIAYREGTVPDLDDRPHKKDLRNDLTSAKEPTTIKQNFRMLSRACPMCYYTLTGKEEEAARKHLYYMCPDCKREINHA